MQLNISIDLFILPIRKATDEFANTIININSVKEFNVTSSWEEMMDTGEITLSRKMKTFEVFERTDNEYMSDIETSISGQRNTKSGKKLYFKDYPILGGFGVNNTGDIPTDVSQPITGSDEEFPPAINAGKAGALFQRGDIIVIVPNYEYVGPYGNMQNTKYNISMAGDKDRTSYSYIEEQANAPRSQIFMGYITSIKSGYDIKISVADYMYFFQQLMIPNAKYLASKYTINSMLVDILNKAQEAFKLNGSEQRLEPIFAKSPSGAPADIEFTLQNYDGTYLTQNTDYDNTPTSEKVLNNITVGDIKAENATVGMVLKTLKDTYRMIPFFYPNSNWLNISPFKYSATEIATNDPLGWEQHTFAFQKNIISSNLDYRKKDDILVGAYVKSVYKKEIEETTSGGKNKTKNESLNIIVGQMGGKMLTFFYTRKDIIPKTEEEFVTSGLKDRMKKFGEEELAKQIYTGYYGSFTTFGYPYVRHGDNILLLDDLYPERKGLYKVKKVKYYGGESQGLRQEITLDLRIG